MVTGVVADRLHRLRQAGVGVVGQLRVHLPERVAAPRALCTRRMRRLEVVVPRRGQNPLLRGSGDPELLGAAVQNHAGGRARHARHAGDVVDG